MILWIFLLRRLKRKMFTDKFLSDKCELAFESTGCMEEI